MSVLWTSTGTGVDASYKDGNEDPSTEEGKEGEGRGGTGTRLIFAVLATDCAVETLSVGRSDGETSLLGVCDVFAVWYDLRPAAAVLEVVVLTQSGKASGTVVYVLSEGHEAVVKFAVPLAVKYSEVSLSPFSSG